MSEVQVTKICTGCKTEKPVTEFHRSGGGRPGLRPKCKACNHAIDKINSQKPHAKARRKREKETYRASNRGREVEAAYRHSALRQLVLKKYHRTPKGKATVARYQATEKYAQSKIGMYARQRHIRIAGSMVKAAVRRGKLPHVTTQKCVRCLKPAQHYHHWSYDRRFRLSVIPLCRDCHVFVHENQRQEPS